MISDNHQLHEKSQVFANIYALHRNPKLWPDSNKFNPDRFATENMQNHHSYDYIPFGAGSRTCLGNFKIDVFYKIYLI